MGHPASERSLPSISNDSECEGEWHRPLLWRPTPDRVCSSSRTGVERLRVGVVCGDSQDILHVLFWGYWRYAVRLLRKTDCGSVVNPWTVVWIFNFLCCVTSSGLSIPTKCRFGICRVGVKNLYCRMIIIIIASRSFDRRCRRSQCAPSE